MVNCSRQCVMTPNLPACAKRFEIAADARHHVPPLMHRKLTASVRFFPSLCASPQPPLQLAVLAQLVMVFFAAQYFRERHYKLFRATHCLYPFIFFAAVVHRFTCFWYFLLGMTIIMADVGQRLTNKIHASLARLTPTGGDRCAAADH
jgi:hypothetical protein